MYNRHIGKEVKVTVILGKIRSDIKHPLITITGNKIIEGTCLKQKIREGPFFDVFIHLVIIVALLDHLKMSRCKVI